ncbi:hypothetical protein [Desulfosporosinus orientis]|uniref:hypothetical protein n=1 Tax=Desulfosporosinus orientis TaxID=1563 RepID=UPI001FA7F290|nr:hypothetical protein [Desulfosporosinus orientis]
MSTPSRINATFILKTNYTSCSFRNIILAIEVLKDIADEERVHAGEFLRLLKELAPDEEKFYQEGAQDHHSDTVSGKTPLFCNLYG